MQIHTHDGLPLTGTPEAIVTALRVRAQTPAASNREFMAHTAARVLTWNHTPLDTTTPQRFLASLAAAGLLTIEADDAPGTDE